MRAQRAKQRSNSESFVKLLRVAAASTPALHVTNRRQTSDPERAKTLLREMDGLLTEDVRKRLSDKAFPLGELRGLAAELGIAAAGKLGRENLVQQVTPKVSNYFAYWRLGREVNHDGNKTKPA
jgi:hypothetical protein